MLNNGNNLGFVMPNGYKYLREQEDHGHIEVAKKIIAEEKLSARYQKSPWKDPVDFLLFEEGALKVGNRWGERVILYYPNLLTKRVKDAILEYRAIHYREDSVHPPISTNGLRYFHL